MRSRRSARLAKRSTAGSPLLVFRRTRADVGIGTVRRVHMLRVRPSAAERACTRRSARYTRGGPSRARCGHGRVARDVGAAQAGAVERLVAGADRSSGGSTALRRRAAPTDAAAGAAARRSAGRTGRRATSRRRGRRISAVGLRARAPAADRAGRRRDAAARGARRSWTALAGCCGAPASRPWSSPSIATRCCTSGNALGASPAARASRRPDARRARGGARRVRARSAGAPAGDRRGRRRAQPSRALPPGRQPRAAVEPDAPRAAHRPRRSHRSAAHRPRVPPDRRRTPAKRDCSTVCGRGSPAAQADIGAPDPLDDDERTIARMVMGRGCPMTMTLMDLRTEADDEARSRGCSARALMQKRRRRQRSCSSKATRHGSHSRAARASRRALAGRMSSRVACRVRRSSGRLVECEARPVFSLRPRPQESHPLTASRCRGGRSALGLEAACRRVGRVRDSAARRVRRGAPSLVRRRSLDCRQRRPVPLNRVCSIAAPNARTRLRRRSAAEADEAVADRGRSIGASVAIVRQPARLLLVLVP